MKWIDSLKERAAEFKDCNITDMYSLEDNNKFIYDVSVSDENICIFINNSDMGYLFNLSNYIVEWSHPEGAEALLPDEIKNQINDILR